MSEDALTVPISTTVAPPMHFFNPMSDIADPTGYFRWTHDLHVHRPYSKLEWKPRLLASLWVHKINPIDWAPRKWVAKSNHSLGYYELTRNLINVEWWTVYLYLVVLCGAVAIMFIRMYLWHPNVTLARSNNGFSFVKPYYVISHNDNYDYRIESGPFHNRGGGKYYSNNYRIIDRFADNYRYLGYAHQRQHGPTAAWRINDPHANPLARAPARS